MKPYTIIRSIMAVILLTQGCGSSDKMPSGFEKVENKHNTFRMVVNPQWSWFSVAEERVRGVRVYEIEDAYLSEGARIHWEIRAYEPVTAKGFEVVQGRYPKVLNRSYPVAT